MNQKVSAIYKETVRLLSSIYDSSEAESITNWLFEDLLELSKVSRLTSPDAYLIHSKITIYENAIKRLLGGEPIQYITGFTDFYGHRFEVNRATLIPRNETEELVDLIINQHENESNLKILDIGTGSGCIAISLALGFKTPCVEAWDISTDAIATSQKNATQNNAKVTFKRMNVFENEPFGGLDIIVSNPPYIPERDRGSMHQNVLDFEPSDALFVSNDNPLIFYERIADLAPTSLLPAGKLYFEIHERFGKEVRDLLLSRGFLEVKIYNDLNGKERMISATNPL